MSDRRLIEEWLPIAALSEESRRERRSMTALPPTYYLHVWWARRPLIASRAAVLASLLPADADREMFTKTIGILGDPVGARRRIDAANRKGLRLSGNAYGYKRAFQHTPDREQRTWLHAELERGGTRDAVVLDPMAGGGSIPFEAARLGFKTIANDLNPVAGLILRATVEWPITLGSAVLPAYDRLSKRFLELAEERLVGLFPEEADETAQVLGYLWARTMSCPYCEGVIPLSPNWKLSKGQGLRLRPNTSGARRCLFEVVDLASGASPGTVKGGSATCPFPDCGRVVASDEVKRQATSPRRLGEQLIAIALKRRGMKTTKTGKTRETWIREYRAPTVADERLTVASELLAELRPEWEARDTIPNESIPNGTKTTEALRFGMEQWTDLFNSRQLLVHGTVVDIYRQLVEEESSKEAASEEALVALAYLALPFDKFRDYNSRMTRWHSGRGVIVNTFDRHDFAFKWSYAELAPVATGEGLAWVIRQVRKALGELIVLGGRDSPAHSPQSSLFAGEPSPTTSDVTVLCESAQSLISVATSSVDTVVMDPPYFQNVMYAELSDFFYVWLKRTAGLVLPSFFVLPETDKENEAVANPSRFRGEKGMGARAARDYQEKMEAVFAQCKRVLRSDGVLVLMFTHKANDAWDALTKGLIDAGFMISASWPVNTESESSLHIKDKSAANSTILLVCRPRPDRADDAGWWEEVEPQLRMAVRSRMDSFQAAGIRGVDLYLSAFGPALEEFSRHWPLRRGQPRAKPATRERKQAELFGEEWDPYAVTPEDALDAARREVKRWRMDQIVGIQRKAELDPVLEFFVLAWDAFEAPRFPYDEALRLARVVGVDLDKEVVGRLCVKKQSNLVMLDAEERAALGALGPADGSRTMLDALHHAAWMGRSRTLTAAKELLERANLLGSPAMHQALAAVLEVLPPFKLVPDFNLDDAVSGAANDFATLEHLRRLCLTGQVQEPKQLAMWTS